MARTESTMVELGTALPAFTLPEPRTGRTWSHTDLKLPLVVMFLCNHCPYVVHVLDGLLALTREYTGRGIQFVAINANDLGTHPQDGPDNMARLAEERNFVFPFLIDETQEVARSFHAACTPDFFVYDGSGRLCYRGQMDSSRPGNDKPVTGQDLRAALDAILLGQAPRAEQRPSAGCNIKWRPAQN